MIVDGKFGTFDNVNGYARFNFEHNKNKLNFIPHCKRRQHKQQQFNDNNKWKAVRK
jgi:hypothetical protein